MAVQVKEFHYFDLAPATGERVLCIHTNNIPLLIVHKGVGVYVFRLQSQIFGHRQDKIFKAAGNNQDIFGIFRKK
ncbi:hypothetical protein D9M69_692330 [compost metagenome]